MSRVERTENTREQQRLAERGRRSETPQRDPHPGHTPGQAEGDERDIEEALQRQEE